MFFTLGASPDTSTSTVSRGLEEMVLRQTETRRVRAALMVEVRKGLVRLQDCLLLI